MANSLGDAIKGMESTVDSLISKITSVSGDLSSPRTGRASTGSNFLNNALGAFSTRPSVRAASRTQLIGGAISNAGQVVSGGFQMMPEVTATMQRMTTYYGAAIRASGGMSRNQMQEATMAGLAGGMTAPGSDAMVAGYLTQRGMMASASFGSTYQETLRGVRGAAQYLNMDNNRAAAAIEGLTSGQGSANMLRNFGIFTADARTGKEKTQGQIMSELYGRLTAGRGTATEEQVMRSYRRGALGSVLRSSGMSEDQQQMFVQYAVERARGNNMDLSDPEVMEELMNKAKAEGNENPNLPGYSLNTTKTGAMQNAQEAYLAGIKVATTALEGLAAVGGEAASVLGGFKSFGGMFGSDPVGQGASAVVGGGLSMAGNLAALGLASKAFGKGAPILGTVAGRMGGPAAAAAVGRASGMAPKALGAAGVVAGGAMGATSIGNAYETAASGGNAFGDILGAAGSGALTGASLGMFLGPKGALIGGAIGGLVGGIGGTVSAIMGNNAEGGDPSGTDVESDEAQASSGSSSQGLSLLHPTRSAEITADFGQRESSFTEGKITWPNGHKGVDYAGSQGDPIYASEGGYATLHDGGQLGKRVRIKHKSGHTTHYCHLSAITIREGQVSKGQQVGKMGNTGGKSTGVHLHFALSTGPTTATAIDPKPYMVSGGKYTKGSGTKAPNPTSAGDLSQSSNPGGEDSSPTPASNASNISPAGTTNNVSNPGGIAGTASSPASDVEAWSSGSVWTGSGGANTAAAPAEGGEGASDDQGYLSPASSANPTRRRSEKGVTKTTTNNVTINLSVEKGTQEEARRFSQMLKRALEDDDMLQRMARN